MKKTYLYAFDFVKPDIVIFLGDLMDEAHVATDQEFYEYVNRLFKIFLGYQRSSENVRVSKHIHTFLLMNLCNILAYLVTR